MFIRRTNQPLEVGTRIRLGGRGGKVYSRLENLNGVVWNDETGIDCTNLKRFPELEIWVDDE